MNLVFKFYDFGTQMLLDVTLIDLQNKELYCDFSGNEGDVWEYAFKDGILLQKVDSKNYKAMNNQTRAAKTIIEGINII